MKSNQSINEKIYENVKDQIISVKLKPKEKLSDLHLSQELGVSRTPVRGALNRLCAEGLVEMNDKGMFVADIDLDYMVNIYQMRAVLEGFAARLALPYIIEDDISEMKRCITEQTSYVETKTIPQQIYKTGRQFHLIILNRCPNPIIVKTITKLIYDCERFRTITHNSLVMIRGNPMLSEHAKIVENIEKGDEDGTEFIVRDHFYRTSLHIKKLAKESC